MILIGLFGFLGLYNKAWANFHVYLGLIVMGGLFSIPCLVGGITIKLGNWRTKKQYELLYNDNNSLDYAIAVT